MATMQFDLNELFDYDSRENIAYDVQRMLVESIRREIDGVIDLNSEKKVKARIINTIAQKIIDMQLEEISKSIDKKAESKINELTNDKLLKIINQKMESTIEKLITEKLSDRIDKRVSYLLEKHVEKIVQDKVKNSLKSMFK